MISVWYFKILFISSWKFSVHSCITLLILVSIFVTVVLNSLLGKPHIFASLRMVSELYLIILFGTCLFFLALCVGFCTLDKRVPSLSIEGPVL